MKYELVVFKEGRLIDDNLYGERCSQILTQMSGCNILLNYNLWFRVTKIKMEQELM
jgi:hypothetical protein